MQDYLHIQTYSSWSRASPNSSCISAVDSWTYKHTQTHCTYLPYSGISPDPRSSPG